MDEKKERFRTYFKIKGAYMEFFSWLLMLSFVVLVGSTLLQVIFRYFINRPLLWSEEMTRYMGIVNTVFCLGAVSHQNAHIKVTFFATLLPKNWHKAVDYIVLLVQIIIGLFLMVYSYQFMMLNPTSPSPAMHWPMWIIYGAIVIGFGNQVVIDCCTVFEKALGLSEG